MKNLAVPNILHIEEQLRLKEMVKYEKKVYKQGFKIIAGIDEAGRGPLAGPVVAAACILPKGLLIADVDDSKKLTPKVREKLFNQLTTNPAIHFGIGIIDSEEIDRINIYQATIQAMFRAIENLPLTPDYLLIDGMDLKHPIPCLKIIKGDQLSQSIAAASIIAKETRDRIMRTYHDQWPNYCFDQHKGYGTEKHLKALEEHGPCPIHRRSFAPIKENFPALAQIESVHP